MTLLVVVLGALFGAGVVATIAALRGFDPADLRPRRRDQVPMSERVERFTLRVALGVGVGVLVAVVTRWPVASLLLGFAGFLAPSLLGGKAMREQRLARIEAIATWAEMLRDTMAGAGGLEQSIIACSMVAPEPIRPEVLRLAARLERDRLAPALRDFADEIDDPTGDLVVAALILAADKSPKRLGALLGMLATSARAEVNMRMRVETGRARTRTSVKVVTISTVLFAGGLMVLNRGYLDPYDSALGQLMMALVGLCFVTAFWWLARAAKIASSERFLTPGALPR